MDDDMFGEIGATFDNALQELLPKIRYLNPQITKEDELLLAAEDYLMALTQDMGRAYYQLGLPPTDDEKVSLLLLLTEHGIKLETAEAIYREIISIRGASFPPKTLPS